MEQVAEQVLQPLHCVSTQSIGHGCVLQSSTFMRSAESASGQLAPPLDAWRAMFLRKVCCPPPHSSEQSPSAYHSDSISQSTGQASMLQGMSRVCWSPSARRAAPKSAFV